MVTVGVHTHITNPLSSGYLCYLACIESWARVADEVVVVDGGSTDNSIPFLMDWLGPLARKVKVISTPETYWGAGEQWFWPQIAINRQVGFAALQTDWAIHVDADHVLSDTVTRKTLLTELQSAASESVLSFWVSAFSGDQLKYRVRSRQWIVNKRKHDIEYGIDEESRVHLDYPINAKSCAFFLDPVTGVRKSFLVGELIRSSGTLDIDTIRYGHFFFTVEQCIYKCRRIDLAISRYLGRAPSKLRQITTDNKISLNKLTPLTKDQILSLGHPMPIKKLIDWCWQRDMLGGVMYSSYAADRLFLRLFQLERKLRTYLMRQRGYRGGLDKLKFMTLNDSADHNVLNICDLFVQQNAYLPKWARLATTGLISEHSAK
ncbi:MAG: glycosyltransferase [candidate division WOR-3 bacterium]